MHPSITGAIIGAAATIVAVLLGKIPLEKAFSYRKRKRYNIPEIMQTRWQADWHYEDGSLYISDSVTFSKWTKGCEFVGFGEVTHEGKEYKYSITGEVGPNRVVVLTYKAEKYPLQGNIGMACLELSNSAELLEGIWAGRSSKKIQDGKKVYMVRSGEVKMRKTKDLS